MWLDLDVVFGDKTLAAEQLSLVPVLVVFHVEDLRWERSREVSAWLPFPGRGAEWGPTAAPDPTTPTNHPLGKRGQCWHTLGSLGSQSWKGSGVVPNPCPGKRVKSVPGIARTGARPVSPGMVAVGADTASV